MRFEAPCRPISQGCSRCSIVHRVGAWNPRETRHRRTRARRVRHWRLVRSRFDRSYAATGRLSAGIEPIYPRCRRSCRGRGIRPAGSARGPGERKGCIQWPRLTSARIAAGEGGLSPLSPGNPQVSDAGAGRGIHARQALQGASAIPARPRSSSPPICGSWPRSPWAIAAMACPFPR